MNDANQRLDAQVRPLGSAIRGRRSSPFGVWFVGRLPPLGCAVGSAHEGVGGVRSLGPRFAGDADQRHSHGRDLILVAAVGVDAMGDKHPLGLIEGATENAATVQALIDNLVERGLDTTEPRLFIIEGSKALSKALRRTFGGAAAIQRCPSTRPATFWSGCQNRCMPWSAACCGRHGSWTTPTRPRSLSPTSLGASNGTGPGFPAQSWKASRKPHRYAAWIAIETALFACLHQHYRECQGPGAPRVPKREAMALGLDCVGPQPLCRKRPKASDD